MTDIIDRPTAYEIKKNTRLAGVGVKTETVYLLVPPLDVGYHAEMDEADRKHWRLPDKASFVTATHVYAPDAMRDEVLVFASDEDGVYGVSIEILSAYGTSDPSKPLRDAGYVIHDPTSVALEDDDDDVVKIDATNYLSWETIDLVREDAYADWSSGNTPDGPWEDMLSVTGDLYDRLAHVQHELETSHPDIYARLESLFRPHVN